MKLEKMLLGCSSQMSKHAMFCMLTLLILLGLTLGLWWAHPAAAPKNADGSTRGSGGGTLCAHASATFDPALNVQALGRLLRAEDAHILYGPDEFGDYQLRLSSSSDVAQALQSLQARPEITALRVHSQCE